MNAVALVHGRCLFRAHFETKMCVCNVTSNCGNPSGAGAGVWGTPMPRRVPVTLVMGAPIVVPHITDPSREQVHLLRVHLPCVTMLSHLVAAFSCHWSPESVQDHALSPTQW